MADPMSALHTLHLATHHIADARGVDEQGVLAFLAIVRLLRVGLADDPQKKRWHRFCNAELEKNSLIHARYSGARRLRRSFDKWPARCLTTTLRSPRDNARPASSLICQDDIGSGTAGKWAAT